MMNVLQEFFDNGLILTGLWLLKSPDLLPVDNFLWGYLKNTIHKNNPHTLEELKNNITHTNADIPVSVLWRVVSNLVRRAHTCIHGKGGHFEHVTIM